MVAFVARWREALSRPPRLARVWTSSALPVGMLWLAGSCETAPQSSDATLRLNASFPEQANLVLGPGAPLSDDENGGFIARADLSDAHSFVVRLPRDAASAIHVSAGSFAFDVRERGGSGDAVASGNSIV